MCVRNIYLDGARGWLGHSSVKTQVRSLMCMKKKPDLLEHTCNPNAWVVETGESLHLLARQPSLIG